MFLISNNLVNKDFGLFSKPDTVIRINIAWIESIKQLRKILSELNYEVFIDFPENRKKPPLSKINLQELIAVIKDFETVKYFAVSNVESENTVFLYKKILPDSICFVPKIETIKGVNNLENIILHAQTKYIMVDTEDLFLDCQINKSKQAESTDVFFLKTLDHIYETAIKLNTNVLKIQGVVFHD